MKFKSIALVIGAALTTTFALAQDGAPSGKGSVTGDPAASSANPRTAPGATTGASSTSNPSGSGTSTSGGRDENKDQGRDQMPDSNMSVRPENQQSRKRE
jgi:hypothetical protein